MYIKVPDKKIVAFDIDSTLVWWDIKEGYPTIEIEVDDKSHLFSYHDKHVDALKKHGARGHTIILWSAGGASWGEAVAKALQIEQYVDIIMPKPDWIYDDLEPNQFLPNNLYIHEGDESDPTKELP